MTYEGFASPAWRKRVKAAQRFHLVTGPTDGRPPEIVDPYGTNPDAWAQVLNDAATYIIEGVRIGPAAHQACIMRLSEALKRYGDDLIQVTFDQGPRSARQYNEQATRWKEQRSEDRDVDVAGAADRGADLHGNRSGLAADPRREGREAPDR